tara:strand:+ start:168 stop:1172 length:1005 start_codon:yes stop_codon:yes gene_type:complete
MAIDDEQAWNKISRDAIKDGFPSVASKAKYLAGQAAYSKPLSASSVPAWNKAKNQAQQAVNNIRFGVTDDLALQRQQMFQDISLSGLKSGEQNRLMNQMESEIDPIIDRQLSLNNMQKKAELDMASDAIMEEVAPEISAIMSDQTMPIGQKFQSLSALQMQIPALAGNKKYDAFFKSAFDSLRSQQWTKQMSQQTMLDEDEKILKKLAERGNVKGLKDYIFQRNLQQGQYDLKRYKAIAEAVNIQGIGIIGAGDKQGLTQIWKAADTLDARQYENFNRLIEQAKQIIPSLDLTPLKNENQKVFIKAQSKLKQAIREALNADDRARQGQGPFNGL